MQKEQEYSRDVKDSGEQEESIETLQQRTYRLIQQAEEARKAFLDEARSKGMTDDEIIEAANEAFNKRQLPRVGTGDVMRGGSCHFAVAGDEVPEGEFPAAILEQYDGSKLIFQEAPTGELPYKEELDDPDAPGAYYVRGIAIGFPDIKYTREEWQGHVAALEEALKTTS